MIEFDCPRCGEPMEVGEKMAGREVRCINCDKPIEVPEESEPRIRRKIARDDGLSGLEFTLFALLFLLPCLNVLISSILYYVWRGSQPKRASQINALGFTIFGIQVVLRILVWVVFQR